MDNTLLIRALIGGLLALPTAGLWLSWAPRRVPRVITTAGFALMIALCNDGAEFIAARLGYGAYHWRGLRYLVFMVVVSAVLGVILSRLLPKPEQASWTSANRGAGPAR